ncbi:hypothetical protein [Enterococcus caccae]|uniref:hypothetical protein n=1 Tax=Enterococcus caccae TaxID=317735 RepID=UPI00039C7DA8|nr:hypothetical protein [Enterococcus caccae]OJG27463.1 hypothetical protein RU98_GL002552 [Enterococcus caccae]
MSSDEGYANTIPPRIISGVVKKVEIDKMKIELEVTNTQLAQITESEDLTLDFSKTVIDHSSDDPTNPTDESRKKEVEKYTVGETISIRLREDIPVRNNSLYIENPQDIN